MSLEIKKGYMSADELDELEKLKASQVTAATQNKVLTRRGYRDAPKKIVARGNYGL